MACVALRTYKPLTTKIELSNIVCVLHYTPMACAALRTYKPLTTKIEFKQHCMRAALHTDGMCCTPHPQAPHHQYRV